MARCSRARTTGRGSLVARSPSAGSGGARAACVPWRFLLSVARKPHGLTLIELVVVLAMVAILVVISFPSLVSLIQRNRVESEVNAMVSSLQLARSEAIKRGQAVSVCASSNGFRCLNANVWSGGWLVFVDRDANGRIDTPADATDLVQFRAAWAGTDTFRATPSTAFVTYNRDGFAVNLPGGAVTLAVRTEPVSVHATRCIALNMVGRQTVQKPGEGACK